MYLNERNLQHLQDIQLKDWKMDELEMHHQTMSDLSPWLNAEGVSYHHKIIDEIKQRGGDTGDTNFTD
ncbi:hypothetical protein [Chengkuizengella axinellae]|uniref:Cytosolic protein n=1 Tax=Chengkuizengella axinellae TaxID=3064388 RepID=A0ABT9J0M0_9BACL|nr:hypothetical protein [Chengkuizengella sp. 2205SS18-9]MDP5275023.1 hypothetical protein [Chengkuizengella sp. 2205SS18-9]